MTARILGLARLHRKLSRLPDAAKAEIRTAMEAAAGQIVAMMKTLVPVLKKPDKRRRAGALRDSIGWTWGKAPKGSTIISRVKASLGGEMTITIYAGSEEAYYARWVEFGTQNMPAQPYFYVSWRANRKEARARMGKAIRSAAKKVAAS